MEMSESNHTHPPWATTAEHKQRAMRSVSTRAVLRLLQLCAETDSSEKWPGKSDEAPQRELPLLPFACPHRSLQHTVLTQHPFSIFSVRLLLSAPQRGLASCGIMRPRRTQVQDCKKSLHEELQTFCLTLSAIRNFSLVLYSMHSLLWS